MQLDKYIIITFSIVHSPYPCHLLMFITENYSSKFTIMFFWAPALKSSAENGIPKKSVNTSLFSRVFLLIRTEYGEHPYLKNSEYRHFLDSIHLKVYKRNDQQFSNRNCTF